MKRAIIMFTALCLFSDLTAAIFGGEPYEVFDQGGTSYIMFGNSLLADKLTLYGEGENRQGDTCRANSTYTLRNSELPIDAVVQKAYLIWTGAVDPEKFDEPTDDVVYLDFYREDGKRQNWDIMSSLYGPKHIGDTSDPFLFESVRFTDDIPVGCSETEPGTMTTAELAYFTYRVDISKFFLQIQMDNELDSNPLLPGEALYGDYTVSGLDCTESDVYRCSTLMVSNWALLLIYQTAEVTSKDIYLYPGFALKKDEVAEVTLGGLNLPNQSQIRLTMLSAEGDPALVNPITPTEQVLLYGVDLQDHLSLTDDCDADPTSNTEVWDSRDSGFLSENGKYCTDHDRPFTFGLDIDKWYLDATGDAQLSTLLPEGAKEMNLSFHFSIDEVLTNLLILSVVTKSSSFDIPGEDELRTCVCHPEEPRNIYCPGEPQYFFVSIENWGDAPAEAVYLKAGYYEDVFDYVPGTTEVATEFDEKGNGLNWQKILDGPEGTFPLREPNLIANRLDSIKLSPGSAPSYLVRFRLLSKADVDTNMLGGVGATISDTENLYNVNNNLYFLLFSGECAQTCTLEELKEKCGGLSLDDPEVFDPAPDDDAIVPDATVDQTPEDDPDATHPMRNQEPGCSLTVI